MKTLLKILLGLLLALIAALVLTPLFLDPNDFKDEISARVAQETGRELMLDGDLKLSVFPWVGIEVNDASLAQPPGFGDEPFARIGQAQIRARLLPLLRGQLELGQIRGEGLALNLIRTRDGRINWDDLSGASTVDGSEPISPPPSAGGGRDPVEQTDSAKSQVSRMTAMEPGAADELLADNPTAAGMPGAVGGSAKAVELRVATGSSVADDAAKQEMGTSAQPPDMRLAEPVVIPSLVEAEPSWQHPREAGDSSRLFSVEPVGSSAASFTIGGLVFEDVHISWDDRQNDTHFVFGGLSLSTGPWAQAASVELHLAGDLIEKGRGLKARFALDSTFTLSGDGRALTLAPFELSLESLTMTDGLSASGNLTGNLRADLEAQRYRFSDLVSDLTLSGGPIAGQSVTMEARAGDLGLDLLEQTVRLDGLTLDSGALRLSGEAAGTRITTAPSFQGRLAIAQLNLRAWLEQHGFSLPDMADRQSLTRVALRSGWRWTAARLDLDRLDATLDRTRITGKAAVIQGMSLGYRFDLMADVLDLDAYLPPSSRVASSGVQTSGAASIPPPAIKGDPSPIPDIPPPSAPPSPSPDADASPERAPVPESAPPLMTVASTGANDLFPVAKLRGLDLDGRIRVGQLRAHGLALGDVDATITARDGRLRLDERVGRFYQGNLAGHVSLLADENPPDLVLVQRAENIQVGPMLMDLIGEDVVTGHGRLEMDLSAKGQSPDALKRTLAGRTAMHFAMGTIKGFNLEQIIRRAEAQLKGRPAPPREPERTDFTELSASAAIADGVLINQDLYATSNYIHATGKGHVDLGNERLDYRLTSKFVDPPKGRGIKEIEDIAIPIRITGSYWNPDWDLELSPILREVAKRELKRELDKKGSSKLQELEERTGIKGLEQGLRRFFDF